MTKSDPVLARVIKRIGPCRLKPVIEGTHFDHIVRAIIYQQLSGKAAGTIHGRVRGLFGGEHPTPAQILATPDDALRAVGLSRQKLAYLKDLAAKTSEGLVALDAIDELDDERIIEQLTSVKGVGRWTAQMFLMFRLGRPDVLPTVDLGINKAIMQAYGLKRLPGAREVLAIGARWSPHATVACWYLWRTQDDTIGRPGAKPAPKVKRMPAPKVKRMPAPKAQRAPKSKTVSKRRR